MGAEAWEHSVADLLQELAERHSIPERLREAGLELDKAYIPTRYPNRVPGSIPARIYTADAAQGALALAREVVVCVQKHMTL